MEYIKQLIKEFNNFDIILSINNSQFKNIKTTKYRYKFFDKTTGKYCFSLEFKEAKNRKQLLKQYVDNYIKY